MTRNRYQEFDYSDAEARRREDALDAPRVAWCTGCDGVVQLDDEGDCIVCRELGNDQDVEHLIAEPLPATSPRTIECPHCGNDPGEYCRVDDNGTGYNHAERVERFEADRGVL